jgi:N-methylhydantoinase A/oxoprolinase/acetone carboxylase beta subunit
MPADIYVATLRVRAVQSAATDVLPPELEEREDGLPRAHRDITIAGRRHADVPILRATEFAPGQRIVGPAVIEAPSYTAVLDAGDVGEVNAVGDVIVEIQEVGA